MEIKEEMKMNKEKQIEEMVKAKMCETCMHNVICQELEEFRNPLGWISTKGEFVCSYYDAGYRKASDVAREIFEEIEKLFFKNGVFIHIQSYNELKKKYTESEKDNG